jgi:transposase
MALVDKTGRLVRFTIRPEDAAKAPELPTLLDGVLTGELIADKAYDSDPIRLALASDSVVATIPPRVNRRVQHWYDPIRYRTRHLVENYFCDLKQFRAVATRYNKLADSYCAMVNLASWIIETRSTRRTAKAPVYKPSDRFPAYNTQLALPLAPAA